MGNDASLESCGCARGPPNVHGRRRGDSGASPSSKNEMASNAKLLRGAREGDATQVRQALDVGANTETRQALGPSSQEMPRLPGRGGAGMTPLMHASKGGHLTCVMALLDARASVEAEDEDGYTALHFAAAKGELDVFKALVLGRGDGLVHDKQGRLPLDHLPDGILHRPDEVRRWEAVMRNELPGCAMNGRL
mmetsp:Transcript_59327/g.150577  ORF Transcript_59327/g.150577 Transcript_59327/m.150577 type:complete len:193 (-) Transcript_59327:125-703(-)